MFFFAIFDLKIKIFSAEQWHVSEKLLATELAEIKNKYNHIYINTGDPKETLLLYDFYEEKNAQKIKNSLTTTGQVFSIDNISLTINCPPVHLDKNSLYLIKRYACDLNKYKKDISPLKILPYIIASDKSGIIYYKVGN